MLIVFRFDASPAIGGGHAVRSGALAAELSQRGHVCGFATNVAGAGIAGGVLLSADILQLPDDEITAMKSHWPQGVDWLVVDHYERDASFESACKGWGRKVMALDDLPTRPHAVDMLVDQTLDRRADEYRELVGPDCKVLAGSEYTLLREEFSALRPGALARRNTLPQSPRIVVSFGTSDPGKATLRTLAALRRVMRPLHVEALVGRLCPHLNEIEAAVRDDGRVSLVVDPSSMAQHLVDADIAIGAPGMTSWERACLGLPSIVIPVVDNQVDNVAALARHGAVTALPVIERVTEDEIAAALTSLLDQPARWRAISVAAARIADGDGAKRVAQAMSEA